MRKQRLDGSFHHWSKQWGRGWKEHRLHPVSLASVPVGWTLLTISPGTGMNWIVQSFDIGCHHVPVLTSEMWIEMCRSLKTSGMAYDGLFLHPSDWLEYSTRWTLHFPGCWVLGVACYHSMTCTILSLRENQSWLFLVTQKWTPKSWDENLGCWLIHDHTHNKLTWNS
jgi:hypothetical protein